MAKRYSAYCTIPLFIEAEDSDEAYTIIKDLFDSGNIDYSFVNTVDLYCEEEE